MPPPKRQCNLFTAGKGVPQPKRQCNPLRASRVYPHLKDSVTCSEQGRAYRHPRGCQHLLKTGGGLLPPIPAPLPPKKKRDYLHQFIQQARTYRRRRYNLHLLRSSELTEAYRRPQLETTGQIK